MICVGIFQQKNELKITPIDFIIFVWFEKQVRKNVSAFCSSTFQSTTARQKFFLSSTFNFKRLFFHLRQLLVLICFVCYWVSNPSVVSRFSIFDFRFFFQSDFNAKCVVTCLCRLLTPLRSDHKKSFDNKLLGRQQQQKVT